MMVVKVLGVGCAKCRDLERKILELRTKHQLEFELIKVTELQEIMTYRILATPGLVINEKLVSVGSIPKDAQLLTWLKET